MIGSNGSCIIYLPKELLTTALNPTKHWSTVATSRYKMLDVGWKSSIAPPRAGIAAV
jgi:hypothetical protein